MLLIGLFYRAISDNKNQVVTKIYQIQTLASIDNTIHDTIKRRPLQYQKMITRFCKDINDFKFAVPIFLFTILDHWFLTESVTP